MTKATRVRYRWSDEQGTIMDDEPATNPMGQDVWAVRWDGTDEDAIVPDDYLVVID